MGMQPCNPEIPPESIPKAIQTYGSVGQKVPEGDSKISQPVAYYWPIKTNNEDGDQTVGFHILLLLLLTLFV